ncbi:pentapeptide repeat-containing protein [Pseudoclavibacter sp. VKM Ac-2888]|uniref:pentapeptide repeat-containing protein n=1 Tax=Pseudoclavibacter sp. VKM Ac-2888 TaxID=2783830 RepID=UPI00188CFB82|nr:pentapeptide repeat-containing protein [Pseudoclavibacter sp. VKM Ac-2888]MBF4549444.1 pentapeptide repeat-containing protein [Pseudoclavibacter sp. VKM Ac-2888]
MTERLPLFRDRIRAFVTPPPIVNGPLWKRVCMRVWVRAWRMMVLAVLAIAAIALGYLLLAGLLVAAPQAIVTETIGDRCARNGPLDCTRAIADARQAVLFCVGGLIAIIGLYFTYRRWMLEHENTQIAADEGRVIEQRHRREGEQLEIGRITDALSLLDSENEAKQTAGISLLTDYALHTPETRHVQVILDVLKAFIERDHRVGWKELAGERTDERLAVSPEAAAALRGLLRASSQRRMNVELRNLTFRELEAPNTDWSYVQLYRVNFSRSNLSEARFGPAAGGHSHVKFETTELDLADFTDARLHHVQFYLSDPLNAGWKLGLTGAKFTRARMRVVSFHGGFIMEPDFDGASLRQVIFTDNSGVTPKAFVGADLMNVTFPEDGQNSRHGLVSNRGTFPMRGLISPKLVTGTVDLTEAAATDGAQPVRDSGSPAGDSRTPEPNPTDESPT